MAHPTAMSRVATATPCSSGWTVSSCPVRRRLVYARQVKDAEREDQRLPLPALPFLHILLLPLPLPRSDLSLLSLSTLAHFDCVPPAI
ncbi:hypothetical protein VTN96DRAFT_1597 [Rasamsonia emersonii]